MPVERASPQPKNLRGQTVTRKPKARPYSGPPLDGEHGHPAEQIEIPQSAVALGAGGGGDLCSAKIMLSAAVGKHGPVEVVNAATSSV